MSGLLGLVQLFVLSAGLLTIITALLIAVAYRFLGPRLSSVGPARRARILTGLCVAPLLVGLLQTCLFFLPGVLGVIWPELDHCLSHSAAGHAHLCLVHPPTAAGAWLGWLVVLIALIGLGRPLLRDITRTWRSARLVRQLIRTAPSSGEDGVRIVESSHPIAAATAVDSEVIVSSSLVEALPSSLLHAVVEHERAHVNRRDPWRRMCAMLFSAGHMPAVRERLLADLELACEQASDETAAAAIGDRVQMAQALLAVARLLTQAPAPTSPITVAFGGSSISARVDALLAPPLVEGRAATEALWLAAATLFCAVAASPGHHLVEHFIALLGQ